MPNDTSRGAGHGGPNAPPSAQEGHPGPAAADRPVDPVTPGLSTAAGNVPESTPSEKDPRLATTLMGIPTVALAMTREKSTAVGHQIHLSADLKAPWSLTPPAELEPADQISGDRGLPPASDDQHDDDPGEQVASSVVGRCLIGAAVGASLALLLIAIVRMHERSNADQGPEGRSEFLSPANRAIPRWKPTATPSPLAPASGDPALPSHPSVSEGRGPMGGPSVPGAAAPEPDARPDALGDVPPRELTGEEATETGRSEGSGTPTLDASSGSDSIRDAAIRPRRPPLRSVMGSSAAKDGVGAAQPPAPPSLNSEPSSPPVPPSANPSLERPRPRTGSSSDPDSTMPPTTN